MTDTRTDRFLDGRLEIVQPSRGYRAGADAVMLAAACPARPGDSVLELGCGVGVVSLALMQRVPGLEVTAIERDRPAADLARLNAAAAGAALRVVLADILCLPEPLRTRHFDHVVTNPPYFRGGTPAPDPARACARHEEAGLDRWLDIALRRLRPGGMLTLIHRADRLDAIMAALRGRAGDIAVLPLVSRQGRAAGRVVLTARKGARGGVRLLAPFVIHAASAHAPGEDLTEAARAVLRGGAPIGLSGADGG